ncbi:MAG TPA: hypothetical protein PLS03_03705 [Terrimicrobiaceae bacterium]|nr:hypothetical protein [Terrimicrobiaceae bacterium]
MSSWTNPLTLNSDTNVAAGSAEAFRSAIQRGADFRVRTDFRYNEHMDVQSDDPQVVQEVSDFRTTYVIDGRWAAGIMTLRYPVAAPHTFGGTPSLSFFIYNENGRQAIARPYLDGAPRNAAPGPSAASAPPDMPKYEAFDAWDAGTNAPSSNFCYHFDSFTFLTRDEWTEVYSHDEAGHPAGGSLAALTDAFAQGSEIKVAISGICDDLGEGTQLPHELIVHCGSGYYCTNDRLFFALTQPTVRVRPSIPLSYTSGGWDFGWLLPHTDGRIDGRICNPYTLAFSEKTWRCPVRWFVRH